MTGSLQHSCSMTGSTVTLLFDDLRVSKLEYSFGCSRLTMGLTEAVGKNGNPLDGRFVSTLLFDDSKCELKTESVRTHKFNNEHAKPTCLQVT